MEKIIKFISNLPKTIREICYLIYLLTKLLSMVKVFFNPNKDRIPPQFDGTDIPQSTPDGIVHKYMTDEEIRSRYSHDNALELDAPYLMSKGVEPPKFSGSVISPLDAHDAIIASADVALSSISKESQIIAPKEPQSTTSKDSQSIESK